jgi:hypothetical protein
MMVDYCRERERRKTERKVCECFPITAGPPQREKKFFLIIIIIIIIIFRGVF